DDTIALYIQDGLLDYIFITLGVKRAAKCKPQQKIMS
ncbi:hypothetical protein LCGC14_2689180, partial [marine sediment metagenome]